MRQHYAQTMAHHHHRTYQSVLDPTFAPRLAAAAGSAEARAILGYILTSGPDDQRDVPPAARYYRAAAESGFARGQLGLALALLGNETGQTGVPQHEDSAGREISGAGASGRVVPGPVRGGAPAAGVRGASTSCWECSMRRRIPELMIARPRPRIIVRRPSGAIERRNSVMV